MGAYAPHAALIASRIRRPNPIVGGVITADLGLVNGTPAVAVRVGGDAVRLATYPLPSAIRVGGPIFVTREGAALTAPLTTVTSNYQVGWPTVVPANTGALLGVAPNDAAAASPSTDWAAATTDSGQRRGSMLPLILGRIPG